MRRSAIIRRWSANGRLSYMLILYIPLLCSFYAYYEPRDTLRQGESISDNGETLVSDGGRFEFGSFSPSGSSGNKRCVGICYHQWDNGTVVWVANRDSPIINANGVFNLTEDGELKVLDSTGKVYWFTDIQRLCPCNLVYGDYGVPKNILSESFNTSTNTLLPDMDVNLEDNMLRLTSWKGSDDPGEGSVNDIYKESNIYCDRFSSYQMDAKLRNLSRDFTARIVMDFSGKLEYWCWDVNDMNWSSVIAEPGNKCAVNNYCGNYGVCNPGNNLVCKCLPGFKPNAPEKWHSGDFSNGCARNSVLCGENDMFCPVYMISEDDNVKKVPVEGESACKEKCLNSCDCKAYYIDKYTDDCSIMTRDPVDLREYDDGHLNFSFYMAMSDIGTNPFHEFACFYGVYKIATTCCRFSRVLIVLHRC
ncbi:hypothetical protein SO802_030014 [Lithocarpus litseifolius]|uniref:non-specific serine/threonine protein kinase n=1 Tax=Lithocarpus litseifolius TaxID=425828 RepID=A0AAW2C0C5_9ROSI